MRGDRVLRVNAFAGVAGDMFVAALLDLGLDLEALRAAVGALGVDGLRIDAERVVRSGISAMRYIVHGPEGGPGHRTWTDIHGVIESADLTATVKQDALGVFRLLFEAEAKVHGATFETVHLHEAGGWDALADIVGAAAGLEALGVGRLECGAVNVGSGTVHTSHGQYPAPAPATAECLRGAETFSDGPPGETATPTGAAILGALGEFLPASGTGPLALEAVGYGAGTRDPEGFANVLQVFLGRAREAEDSAEDLLQLETNLDDCDPRTLGPLLDRLLEAGAVDAWHTAVQMKKGRPGVMVSALVPETDAAAAGDVLFSETTTLGIRVRPVERWTLERSLEQVETPWGRVAVKVGREGDEVLTAQPEFEDCARLAREHGVPVKEVIRHALAAWTAARGKVERGGTNEGTL